MKPTENDREAERRWDGFKAIHDDRPPSPRSLLYTRVLSLVLTVLGSLLAAVLFPFLVSGVSRGHWPLDVYISPARILIYFGFFVALGVGMWFAAVREEAASRRRLEEIDRQPPAREKE